MIGGLIGRLAARLRPAAGAARTARPAGAVVAAAAGSAAAAPHQFPADPAAVRDRAEGRDAGAHAVVAHAAAADARRLVIIAAAGPLWNPPLATSSRAAPLLVMIDDGWPAAAAWDERLRTADEIIARADADNRGVALLPLSETGRDISMTTAGAARVQVKQFKPQAAQRGSHRGAAADRAFSLEARRTSRWSGSPTASISARAPNSSPA